MNSKPIIAGLIGISAFQGVWALTPHAGEKSPCRKPNVVIFFTDDQGERRRKIYFLESNFR